MQTVLQALLNTELADVFRAAVVGLIFGLFYAFFFGLVDAADIANCMACEFGVRVVAKQPRLDVNPRKTVTLGRKPGDFFITEPVANRPRFKAFGFLPQFFETAPIPRRDFNQLRQLVDGLGQVGHFGGGDFQGVGGIVGGQHDAVAVQDLPAVGNHRHDGRAVAFGLRPQVVVAHHLQVHQARGHQ